MHTSPRRKADSRAAPMSKPASHLKSRAHDHQSKLAPRGRRDAGSERTRQLVGRADDARRADIASGGMRRKGKGGGALLLGEHQPPLSGTACFSTKSGHGHSRHHRVATEVATARLQRWFRAALLHKVLKSPGVLVTRLKEILTLDHKLWKLRVRMAKRIIVQACTAYAISFSKNEVDDTACTSRFVTVVCAFLRALKSRRISSQMKHTGYKRAVRVIEKLWLQSANYKNFIRTSRDKKFFLLLLDEESIERRDYDRQRLLFIIQRHQEFYNDPIARKAGLFVRGLGSLESIFGGEASEKDKLWELAPNPLEDGATESSGRSHPLPYLAPSWLCSSRRSSAFRSHSNFFGSLSDEAEMMEGGKGETASKLVGKETKVKKVDVPYRKRANTCFVTAIYLEEGRLAFPSSMGACQFVLDPKPETSGGSAPLSCKARIQDTENALGNVERRYTWKGAAIVREPLQAFTVFREYCVLLNHRKEENRRESTKAFVLGSNVAVENLFFLYPPTHRSKDNKGNQKVPPFSVTANVMGDDWSKLLYLAWAERNSPGPSFHYSASPSPVQEPTFACSRRKTLQLNTRGDTAEPLHCLLSLARRPRRSTVGSHVCSVRLGDDACNRQDKNDYDCERVIYEIERLLIQEYRRRQHIVETCNAGFLTIEWMIGKRVGLPAASKNTAERVKGRGVPPVFVRVVQESRRMSQV
uniref:Uncharacterized protein TCIL3000_10_5160 n=1 Tax=Trypanosoma congolense (strain IL3000) TaxID=1068625 RepID=G0UWI5_TRYCI|nr:unnamed protein product [Trypanosoma congolense IL3000]